MHRHVGLLNRWLVKMSDLDATNFAISGVLATALQVFAVLVAFNRGLEAGELLSLVLYVVEFLLVATLLPTAWQDCIRLRDILTRLHGNLPAARN